MTIDNSAFLHGLLYADPEDLARIITAIRGALEAVKDLPGGTDQIVAAGIIYPDVLQKLEALEEKRRKKHPRGEKTRPRV